MLTSLVASMDMFADVFLKFLPSNDDLIGDRQHAGHSFHTRQQLVLSPAS